MQLVQTMTEGNETHEPPFLIRRQTTSACPNPAHLRLGTKVTRLNLQSPPSCRLKNANCETKGRPPREKKTKNSDVTMRTKL